MTWSSAKIRRILNLVLPLQAICAIAAIALIVYNLTRGETSDQFNKSFVYLIATAFGNGLGCTWFRIRRAKTVKMHGFIHSVVLIAMIVGHREIFTLMQDKNYATCYNKYSISMLTIIVYIFQTLLTVYFMLTHSKRRPEDRAFRYGLHTFIGVLSFFISSVDGVLVSHRMARDEGLVTTLSFNLACVCVLSYCVLAWYTLLNPYFDWRKTFRLLSSRSRSKKNSRSPSQRSSIRFSTNTP